MKDEKQRTHEDLVVNSDTAAQMFFILYIAVDKTPVSSRHGKKCRDSSSQNIKLYIHK